jgi:hypothetical protein
MPGSQRLAYGNEIYDLVIAPSSPANASGTLTWSSATLGATTTSELTTTVLGLLVGDLVDLYLTSGPMTTGLQIANVRVSAANVLAVTWVNSTAGSLTIPTGTWSANLTRPESASSLPPNAV